MDGLPMENSVKLDDLGGTPISGNPCVCIYIYTNICVNVISSQNTYIYTRFIHIPYIYITNLIHSIPCCIGDPEARGLLDEAEALDREVRMGIIPQIHSYGYKPFINGSTPIVGWFMENPMKINGKFQKKWDSLW